MQIFCSSPCAGVTFWNLSVQTVILHIEGAFAPRYLSLRGKGDKNPTAYPCSALSKQELCIWLITSFLTCSKKLQCFPSSFHTAVVDILQHLSASTPICSAKAKICACNCWKMSFPVVSLLNSALLHFPWCLCVGVGEMQFPSAFTDSQGLLELFAAPPSRFLLPPGWHWCFQTHLSEICGDSATAARGVELYSGLEITPSLLLLNLSCRYCRK